MVDILKNYASKRLDLIKMEATEKGSLAAGTTVVLVAVAFFAIFFLILLNIGIACLIGQALDNMAYGFLIVAGIYLLLIVILIVAMKGIKNAIANKIISSIYKD